MIVFLKDFYEFRMVMLFKHKEHPVLAELEFYVCFIVCMTIFIFLAMVVVGPLL